MLENLRDIISVGSLVLSIIVIIVMLMRSSRPITVNSLADVAKDVKPLAEQIESSAMMIVQGVQEAKEKGRIDSGNDAFQEASRFMELLYPDLDTDIFIPFIDGAYRLLMKRDTLTGVNSVNWNSFVQMIAELAAEPATPVLDPPKGDNVHIPLNVNHITGPEGAIEAGLADEVDFSIAVPLHVEQTEEPVRQVRMVPRERTDFPRSGNTEE